MMEQDVIVYVSDNNRHCTQVIELVDEYNVSYRVKNVSKNKDYMKELQEKGIFGTPALFIKGEEQTILGYQKEKIRKALHHLKK